jgi:uncharacterized protein (DUF362 family)
MHSPPHRPRRPPKGRVIQSRDIAQEFAEKELSRRRLIAGAARLGAGAGLAGIPGISALSAAGAGCQPAGDDDGAEPTPEPPRDWLVGMGSGEDYGDALEAALAETIGRDRLAFVGSGDVVYLKVNSNSGDPYPYSTRPSLVERMVEWSLERGASRVIVGDRSFWGDSGTYGNLVDNGIVDATEKSGGELIVFDEDDGDVEWVEFSEDDAPDWNGGFRFPRMVVEADHIINLPIVKTHFISGFTMGMKNIIGLVHALDREREGNLDVHVTAQRRLYKQIAQLNQRITPSLTILDGWEAVIRGGPTIAGNPSGLEGEPRVMIVSTDRVAADVTGLAVLKRFAVDGEAVHDYDVWENPQIEEAVDAGVGISGPDEYEASGPTVEDLDEYLELITG